MPLLRIAKKIISTGVRSNHDSEARRKIFLFNVFSHVSIICLVSLGITAFIQKSPLLGIIDLSVAVLLISLIIYLYRSGNHIFCSHVAALLANIFFCYLFVTGGVNSTAFMWLYTYPTLAFFLLSLAWGSMATLVLFLFSLIFLIIDLSSDTINVYNVDFAIRYIPSFLVVFLFSFLLERNRVGTYKALVEKQEMLTHLVDELKTKETQLELAQDRLELRVAERTAELIDMNEKFREEIEARKKTEKERRRLEAELSRAQKMEVLGILAGGVAHDLNNVLSGIVSYPDLLLTDLSSDDPLRAPLETIRKSGKNAAAIVQDLLSLSRRGVMIREMVSVNTVIKEYFQSPEYQKLSLVSPGISVTMQLKNDLQLVEGSPVHLQKIVMNLVINAFEAIEGVGKVTVSTENKILHAPLKGYELISSGSYVVLTIQDSGSGMSADVVEKIFEPFYTRKQMGRSGTGLGMTVVWGTIKDHGGFLDINSAPELGTTISIFFPAALSDRVAAQEEPVEKNKLSQGKGQMVLIADDVREQREIGVSILEKLGYQAWAVPSGEEAVKFIKEHPVDLVLLDMIMPPGIDGLDTFQEILSVNPDQKAVLVSGYSENDRVREALDLGIGAYLKKPYTIEQISQVVTMELGR